MRAITLLFIATLHLSSHANVFIIEKQPEFALPENLNIESLCEVSEHTQRYINEQPQDTFAVHGGYVFMQPISLTQIKATLSFICKVHHEDMQANRSSRLNDKNFLKQNFEFLRWYPDKTTANAIADKSTHPSKTKMLRNIPQDELFLTKYYTKLLHGSTVQTDEFTQALYALPYDETDLTLEQAKEKKEQLTRFRFTRQQVISGKLLQDNLAKPLVWITEEALHDVLLQGTGVLNIDGKTRYFNVHRNNDIAYDYSIGKREQARYWYFAEVPSIMGYGQNLQAKIAVKPYVTFAGNVKALGLGKLIMVSYETQNQSVSKLGILADQGGAFDNNLFQLDLLVDSYFGWSDYHKANKHLPDYAKTWILLVKGKR